MLARRSLAPPDRAIALTLIVAVAVVAELALATLGAGPSLAGTLRPAGGEQTIGWVMPGGAAAEAGLRAGDVVRAVETGGRDDGTTLAVVSGRRAGETVNLVRRWPVVTDLLLFAVGVEFLVVGLLVLSRATDRPAARRFVTLAGAAAVTFVAFPAIGSGHPWALALEWLGSKVGMAGFVAFFLTVPTERWSGLRRALTLAPVPILACYAYTVAAGPDLYAVVKPIGYSYMALAILTSLAAMLWRFRPGASREQRRLWPVLACSGAAAGFYLLASLLPYVLFRRYLLPAELAVGVLLLVPLGFAWAMLRHSILGATLGPWAVIRTVFAAVGDPILVVGRDGRLVEASATGTSLLGLPEGRGHGADFSELLARWPEAAREAAAELLRRVLAGEAVQDRELLVRRPDGTEAWLSVSGTPVRDERGQVELAVLVGRDVSERRRREDERAELLARETAARIEAERLAAERAAIIAERRALERDKDEFLANISHDLRTPLTAIKHSIEIVLANEPADLPGALHRMLANVDVAADRMTALVENLLDLARLQSGRIAPRLARHDLVPIARRAATTIEPSVVARRGRLETLLPAGPVPAVVDAERVERALLNLLSNAQKHGRSGGTIRLGLAVEGGEAVFSVVDDGPGIPPSERERIFERFHRLGADGPTGGGSGLGLAITKTIAELHGGQVWVTGADGGADFRLALPLGEASAAAAEPASVEASR